MGIINTTNQKTHHDEKGTKGLTTFVKKYPETISHLEARGFEFDEFVRKWMRLTKKGFDD